MNGVRYAVHGFPLRHYRCGITAAAADGTAGYGADAYNDIKYLKEVFVRIANVILHIILKIIFQSD